jgi:hypothetical protein
MPRIARHRYLVYLPFVLLLAATVLGGWLNTVDMRGRVIDDLFDSGLAEARLTLGQRTVTTDTSGAYEFPNLPRTARVTVDKSGYFRQTVPTTQEDIRLQPNSVTVRVLEAGAFEKPVAGVNVRQGDKLLGTTLDSGTTVISPHPGKDVELMACKEGYDMKKFKVTGVLQTIELSPGTIECPPLPTPSPSPSPSPTASPTGSPTPSPTPSPSPSQ